MQCMKQCVSHAFDVLFKPVKLAVRCKWCGLADYWPKSPEKKKQPWVDYFFYLMWSDFCLQIYGLIIYKRNDTLQDVKKGGILLSLVLCVCVCEVGGFNGFSLIRVVGVYCCHSLFTVPTNCGLFLMIRMWFSTKNHAKSGSSSNPNY